MNTTHHTQVGEAPEIERLLLVQSPIFIGISAILAGLFGLFSFLNHKAPVHYKSPPFYGDVLPILGANSFIFRPW